MSASGPSATPGTIVVRHCRGLAEFEECMKIELAVWGDSDLHVPLPLYVVAEETGGWGRGIELVEWTFDPLEIKNAHFNLVRLGAIARRYIPNCYGITSSPLHAGLPTDRVMVGWWLESARVEGGV